jgi:uncharacterized membrane protein
MLVECYKMRINIDVFQASMLVDKLQAIIDVNGAIASLINDYLHKMLKNSSSN